MKANDEYCLRWNCHQSTLSSVFGTLLKNEILVDCTLAAEGQYIRAHRVLLSACSPYFDSLLGDHYDKHPILILKDVKFSEIKLLMDYMYRGEVNVSQDHLGSFLKAAESLQIKGLSENENDLVFTNHKNSPEPVKSPRSVPAKDGTAHSRSNEPSKSQPSRKRKKVNCYSSAVEGVNLNASDSHETPSQAQKTLLDASDPSLVSISTYSSSTVKNLTVKPYQTDTLERISRPNLNSSQFESGMSFEPLLEPKKENLEDINAESDVEVEDLTPVDGKDVEDNICFLPNDMSVTSHQALEPWRVALPTGDTFTMGSTTKSISQSVFTSDSPVFVCRSCGKSYRYKTTLLRHQRYECGDKRPFSCSLCSFTTKQNCSLKLHMISKH